MASPTPARCSPEGPTPVRSGVAGRPASRSGACTWHAHSCSPLASRHGGTRLGLTCPESRRLQRPVGRWHPGRTPTRPAERSASRRQPRKAGSHADRPAELASSIGALDTLSLESGLARTLQRCWTRPMLCSSGQSRADAGRPRRRAALGERLRLGRRARFGRPERLAQGLAEVGVDVLQLLHPTEGLRWCIDERTPRSSPTTSSWDRIGRTSIGPSTAPVVSVEKYAGITAVEQFGQVAVSFIGP
jgi:hypothetical protein